MFRWAALERRAWEALAWENLDRVLELVKERASAGALRVSMRAAWARVAAWVTVKYQPLFCTRIAGISNLVLHSNRLCPCKGRPQHCSLANCYQSDYLLVCRLYRHHQFHLRPLVNHQLYHHLPRHRLCRPMQRHIDES